MERASEAMLASVSRGARGDAEDVLALLRLDERGHLVAQVDERRGQHSVCASGRTRMRRRGLGVGVAIVAHLKQQALASSVHGLYAWLVPSCIDGCISELHFLVSL